LRREHPAWFGKGSAHIPMLIDGTAREYLVGYLRGENVAVLAPRWNLKHEGNFGSTTVELPHGSWRNVLTAEVIEGGTVRAQNILKRFPVALLVRNGD
jgi:(1->4)-alpha-D-glucan 1-alpha-D-glucosylmutase